MSSIIKKIVSVIMLITFSSTNILYAAPPRSSSNLRPVMQGEPGLLRDVQVALDRSDINDPDSPASIGSVLGLFDTLRGQGFGFGDTITIKGVKPHRLYREDYRDKKAGDQYVYETVRREFRDAEDLELIRNTGDRDQNGRYIYEILVDPGLIRKLPGDMLEMLNRGRARKDEIRAIRQVIRRIVQESESIALLGGLFDIDTEELLDGAAMHRDPSLRERVIRGLSSLRLSSPEVFTGIRRYLKRIGLYRHKPFDRAVELVDRAGNVFTRDMAVKGITSSLVGELAPLVQLREDIARIPPGRKLNKNQISDLLAIIQKVSRVALFTMRNPRFSELNLYESLCFIDDKGTRKLAIVLTPMAKRAFHDGWSVVVLSPDKKDRYSKRRVNLSDIEMVSDVLERMELDATYQHMLKFKVESLEYAETFGTSALRGFAIEHFLTLASDREVPRVFIEEAEKVIGKFSKSAPELSDIAVRLNNNEMSVEELDTAFNSIIASQPELLDYLQFTGDATGTWYSLLDYLRTSSLVSRVIYQSNPGKESRALVAQNAVDHAIVSAWIQAHRKDFRSPLGERPIDTRITDFIISMAPSSFGDPAASMPGFEALEFNLCAACAWTPCGLGQIGSLAIRLKVQAGIVSGILRLMEGANTSQSAASYLRGKMTPDSEEEIIARLRKRAKSENISGDQVRRERPNLDLIDRWLAMDRAKLEEERDRLLAESQRKSEESKALQENKCPLHLPIPKLLNLMALGRFEEAVRMLMDSSFGGAYLGLICPQEHLCQAACTLGRIEDRPVPIDIGKLEYLIVQTWLKLNNGKLPQPRKEDLPKHNGKYAVVLGSGPAGLQQAYDLARKGHKVVVMEALHEAGGVLGYGIPTFRLQEGIVGEHVRYLKEEMGVQFVLDTHVGENGAFTIDELRMIFDTVFISTGAGKSNVMQYGGKPIPGRHLNGIYSAYHFLSWTYLMKAMVPGYKTPPPLAPRVMDAFERAIDTGKPQEITIVVEGIGNVAMDSARTALRWINVLNMRMGTEVKPKIVFLYRRPQQHLSLKARREELTHALEEGAGVIAMVDYELHQAIEYIGDEDGNIQKIECIRYASYKGPEKDRVKIKADMVIESLGTKPATETLSPSIPLNEWGYVEIKDSDSMQVKGLDGSDGLAPVYVSGDAAEVIDELEGAAGTAVLAAAQGKRAAAHYNENYSRAPALEHRIEDPEKLFFTEEPFREMFEILKKEEVSRRDVEISRLRPSAGEKKDIIGAQRMIEFTVYAPYIARRIQPGQFFTVMSDEFGEKIPITFLGKDEESGTIRFSVQDAGLSTHAINNMNAGDRFFSISGPGGEPSIFAGLIGEVMLVGLGGAIPTIVSIVRARAELDKKMSALFDLLGRFERGENTEETHDDLISAANRVLNQVRLSLPQEIKEITEALDKNQVYRALQGLKKFREYASGLERVDARIGERITALYETAIAMKKKGGLSEDETDVTQAVLKYTIYPELDRIWRSMEEQQLAAFRSSVMDKIGDEKYKEAGKAIERIIGAGFKTKVVLGAFNPDNMIYLKELEGYVGKENIYIALEQLKIMLGGETEKINWQQYEERLSSLEADADLNADKISELKTAVGRAADRGIGEGYYSKDTGQTRFFFGYGTLPFRALISRKQGSKIGYSAALVAGPSFAMHVFVDEADRADMPDVLDAWDVHLSLNSPMFCIYGGCLYCLLLTDEKTIVRGCLGPEFPGKRIDKKAFLNRLKPTAPPRVLERQVMPLSLEEAEAELDRALVALNSHRELSGRFASVIAEKGIENTVMFADSSNGVLYVAMEREDDKVRLIPVYGKGRTRVLTKDRFIRRVLGNIDTQRLGIAEHEKASYAVKIKTALDLGEEADRYLIAALKIPGIKLGSGRDNENKAGPITIEEALGSGAKGFPITATRHIPGTSLFEMRLSAEAYQEALPGLSAIALEQGVELPGELTEHDFILVEDGQAKTTVAIILRNRTRVSDLMLWTLGDTPEGLLEYLVSQAEVAGLNPFVDYTVEEIKPGAFLAPGVDSEAGSSVWNITGHWSEDTVIAHAFEFCNQCTKCVDACPDEAIMTIPSPDSPDDKIVIGVDAEFCKSCDACMNVCPIVNIALTRVSKEDTKFLHISMDSTSEGRAVKLAGANAEAIGGLISQGDPELLSDTVGLDDIDFITDIENLLQVGVTRNRVRYLITYVKDKKSLIIKPMRTLIVLGFEGQNRKLAEDLREQGFGAVIVLAENSPDFKHLRQDAVSAGFKVYALLPSQETAAMGIARNTEDQSDILTELPEEIRLANPVTVDPDELTSTLGAPTFAKLISRIGVFNGTSLIRASRPLPTRDADLDTVMKRFRPSFDEQERTSAPGGGLCPGCGQPLAVKTVLETLNPYALHVSVATGCLEVSSSGWPFITWLVNAVHGNYTAAASISLGIARAARWFQRMKKKIFEAKPFIPVVFMGDGGFAIGMSVVSTVLKTGPTLIVVSNNFRTSNTGYQPTQLAQEGETGPGYADMVSKPGFSIPEFAMAHPDVYYARVSESDPEDFKEKMERAGRWVAMGKSAIIESYGSACPTGWKSDFTQSIEEEALAVKTGIGMVPFEIVNGRVRITRYPGDYDGKIYINSEYLEGTRYQLQGLVEQGLLKQEELEAVMAVLTEKKERFFRRALDRVGFGRSYSASSLMAKLSVDDVIENLVLQSINIPIDKDGEPLLADLAEFNLDPRDIETIMSFRETGHFNSRDHFISEVNVEAYDAIFKGVMGRMTTDDVTTLVHTLTEAEQHRPAQAFKESKTEPFTPFRTLEDLSEELYAEGRGPLSIGALGSIIANSTLDLRRPHIASILARQRRFSRLLRDREWVDKIQKKVNEGIDELLARAERDADYFVDYPDSLLFSSEPPEVKGYRFNSASEAHEYLVGTREILKYEDAEKNRRVEEENRARRARLSEKLFEARFHGRGGFGAVTAALSLAKLCGETLGLEAQGMPRFGGERLMAPVEAYLRAGTRIKNRTSVKEPDAVCVLNESLLGIAPVAEGLPEESLTTEEEWMRDDILASFRPGGMLVVNTTRNPDEVKRELTAQDVNTEGMRIFTIDATGIAKKYIGDPRRVNMIMAAALVRISQIAKLDLDTEISIDYLAKVIKDDFGPKVAERNKQAMERAVEEGIIKIEAGQSFRELRRGYLASVEEVERGPARKKKPARKVATVTRVLDSNKAAVRAAIQSGVNYCAGYPIFPSTGGTEDMAKFAEMGLPLEFDLLGSEDAVASAILGASLAGMRVTTFSASEGLKLMLPHLQDMFGKLLKGVINLPIRALNIGTLSIFPDESDMVMVKDYGIFLRARNAQEVYDMNIIGWRITERMSMPVYVVYTGTLNSHTAENVEVFTDYEAIEKYIGPRRQDEKGTALDQDDPRFYGAVTNPNITQEIITRTEEDLVYKLPGVIEEAFREFEETFGVSYTRLTVYLGDEDTYTEQTLDEIETGKVDELIIASGANEETTETVVDRLRAEGRRTAVLNVTNRYPFPEEDLRAIIRRLEPKVVLVLDNVKSADMHRDVVSALYHTGTGQVPAAVVKPVVYGLGGRELDLTDIELLYDTLEAFKVIRELGRKGKPAFIGKRWLGQIIESEITTVLDVKRYIAIQMKFEKLYGLDFMLTDEERGALALTEPIAPTGSMGEAELKAWQAEVTAFKNYVYSPDYESLVVSAQTKLDTWGQILEAYQSGVHIDNPGIDTKVFDGMLARLSAEISGDVLKFYHDFNDRVITGDVPGNRDIGTLLSLIDEAAKATGMRHLERDVIVEKITSGRILEIFGDKYMYGARRKFDQYNNLHRFVIELGIRVARRLLESEKGNDAERLMVARSLLDLSEVERDREIAMNLIRGHARASLEEERVNISSFLAEGIIGRKQEFKDNVLKNKEQGEIIAILVTNPDQLDKVSEFEDLGAEIVQLHLVGGAVKNELMRAIKDEDVLDIIKDFPVFDMNGLDKYPKLQAAIKSAV